MERDMGYQTLELSYGEALRLGWALLWRSVGSFLVLMFAMNSGLLALLPELRRMTPSLWIALMPLAFATVISAFFIMPLCVVRGLVRIRFRGFRVHIVHEPQMVHDR